MPGAVGRTPISSAEGAGATTIVSACVASTEPPVSAPDAERGSARTSDATG